MKFKVTISKEIIYQKIIIANDEDHAEELANDFFETAEEMFEEVDGQFEIIAIDEIKE